MKNPLPAILAFALMLALCSCAHVPPEAPELSAELGKRIAAIKESHLSLVDLYFKEKRANIDDFLRREWAPTFVNNLLETEFVAGQWRTACGGDKQEQTRFMLEFSRVLQEKVAAKRAEMVAPLDELESALKADLHAQYDEATAVNTVLTGFLAESAEVEENRRRALEQLGVDDQRVTATMHQVDDALDAATKSAQDLEENLPGYVKRIKSLIRTVSGH